MQLKIIICFFFIYILYSDVNIIGIFNEMQDTQVKYYNLKLWYEMLIKSAHRIIWIKSEGGNTYKNISLCTCIAFSTKLLWGN